MREGAADGDIHEEQPERGVAEFRTRMPVVKLPREEQRKALRYGILAVGDYTPSGQTPMMKQLGEPLAQLLESGIAPREGEGDQQAARETLQKLLEAKNQFMEQRRKQS